MGFNESYTLSAGVLSDYVQLAQENLPSRNRLLLLGFINIPTIIIALHVIWQLVSSKLALSTIFSDLPLSRLGPGTCQSLPLFSIGFL